MDDLAFLFSPGDWVGYRSGFWAEVGQVESSLGKVAACLSREMYEVDLLVGGAILRISAHAIELYPIRPDERRQADYMIATLGV
jgi:hypothetical protein